MPNSKKYVSILDILEPVTTIGYIEKEKDGKICWVKDQNYVQDPGNPFSFVTVCKKKKENLRCRPIRKALCFIFGHKYHIDTKAVPLYLVETCKRCGKINEKPKDIVLHL